MKMGRYPLESGEPCLKHSCSLCCQETRMSLTVLDINRIIKLGYKTRDFAEKSEGMWRLKNIDGRCFFLSWDARCTIYKYRPYGCRLYPLIYNWNERKVTLDNLCPYRMDFNFNVEDVRMLMRILRLL